MMALTFARLRADPPKLNDLIDIIGNLEADLCLENEGETIYEEVSFPVAELAVALTRWLQEPPDDRPDFEFDSMAAEELGMLWIRRVSGGWRVGSIYQERPEMGVFSSVEVENLVQKFIGQLTEHVERVFGSRVLAILIKALRAGA